MATLPAPRVTGLLASLLLVIGVAACGDDGSSSDGRIVFGSAREGGGLFVVSPSGSDVTWVPVPPGGNYPDWGPDGRIAFTRMVSAGTDPIDIDIFVTDVDGGGYGVLVDGEGWDHQPAWSPDGDWLAFTSDRDGDDSIYLARADGSNPLLLVEGGTSATWRDDSAYIAYAARRDGNTDVYATDVTGSNTIRLTDDPDIDREPAWSPDGTRIAFVSRRDGDLEIYVMDADGANQVRLTASEGIDALPAWSPDSSQIVFISERGGDGLDLYVMDADGSNVRQLTTDPANDFAPSWG